MDELHGTVGEVAAPRSPIRKSTPLAHSPPFQAVLEGLAREVDRGEKVVGRALRANPLSGTDRGMIALQAGVYRYVESIELCTKLVDRAAGAVRTVLQTQ